MAVKKAGAIKPGTGRMPEQSTEVSGDESKGMTPITAAQPQTVRQATLDAIAKPKVKAVVSKEHKLAWAKLDAGPPGKRR